jgi:hypothetical protein
MLKNYFFFKAKSYLGLNVQETNLDLFRLYTSNNQSDHLDFLLQYDKTFYQRTLLGTSANQKRHYLKSYNNIIQRNQDGDLQVRLSL